MAGNQKVIVRDEPEAKTQAQAPDKRSELQKRIEAKADSRAFNAKFLDGKAVLFDLDNYGVDYQAGGLLKGRFVLNNPARISIMRAQGYLFPEEWDSELPNNEFGGLTLMLQESKHAASKRRHHESLALQQEKEAHITEAVKDGKLELDKDLTQKESKYETFKNKPERKPVGPD